MDRKKAKKKKFFEPYMSIELLEPFLLSGEFLEGRFLCAQYCLKRQFGVVELYLDTQLITVNGLYDLNRSFENDHVVVVILERFKTPVKMRGYHVIGRGKVVSKLETSLKHIVGMAQLGVGETVLVPSDRSLPTMLLLMSSDDQQSSVLNKLCAVKFIGWPEDSSKPQCRLVRLLGEVGKRETTIELALFENTYPELRFPPEITETLPTEVLLTDDDVKDRTDFTDCLVFSVDSPTCRVRDDTIHWRKFDDGSEEIGCHITDISFYVKAGSLLDTAARARSSTLYLGDRRFDMFPAALSTGIGSLNPGELRSVVGFYRCSRCVSLMTRFNAIDRTCRSRFKRTIIRSKVALSSEEAELLCADEEPTGNSLRDSVGIALRRLCLLCDLIKTRQLENGSNFYQASSKIFFDRIDDDTYDLHRVESVTAVSDMVRFLMEFTNTMAADAIYASFPSTALLRGQEHPTDEQLKPLADALKLVDVTLNDKTFSDLQASVGEAVKTEEPEFNIMVQLLARHCLETSPAFMFCAGLRPARQHFHFVSNRAQYTRVTSPARRYSDVISQRQLLHALDLEAIPPEYACPDHMQRLADELTGNEKREKKLVRLLKVRPSAADIAAWRTEDGEVSESVTETRRQPIPSPPDLKDCSGHFDEPGNVLYATKDRVTVFLKRYGQTGYLEAPDFLAFDEMTKRLTAGSFEFRFYLPVVVKQSITSNGQHDPVLQLVEPTWQHLRELALCNSDNIDEQPKPVMQSEPVESTAASLKRSKKQKLMVAEEPGGRFEEPGRRFEEPGRSRQTPSSNAACLFCQNPIEQEMLQFSSCNDCGGNYCIVHILPSEHPCNRRATTD